MLEPLPVDPLDPNSVDSTADQHIAATGGPDILTGGAGNDTVTGGAGNDAIDGHAGADSIDAGPGDDLVHGNDRNDAIFGAAAMTSCTVMPATTRSLAWSPMPIAMTSTSPTS